MMWYSILQVQDKVKALFAVPHATVLNIQSFSKEKKEQWLIKKKQSTHFMFGQATYSSLLG